MGFCTPDLLLFPFFIHCERSITLFLWLKKLHTSYIYRKIGFREAVIKNGKRLSLATVPCRHAQSSFQHVVSDVLQNYVSPVPDSNGPVSPFPLLLLALSSLCFICFLTLFSLQVFSLDSIYSPQSPECVVLLAILMWIRSLSFRPSTVFGITWSTQVSWLAPVPQFRSWMSRS